MEATGQGPKSKSTISYGQAPSCVYFKDCKEYKRQAVEVSKSIKNEPESLKFPDYSLYPLASKRKGLCYRLKRLLQIFIKLDDHPQHSYLICSAIE